MQVARLANLNAAAAGCVRPLGSACNGAVDLVLYRFPLGSHVRTYVGIRLAAVVRLLPVYDVPVV